MSTIKQCFFAKPLSPCMQCNLASLLTHWRVPFCFSMSPTYTRICFKTYIAFCYVVTDAVGRKDIHHHKRAIVQVLIKDKKNTQWGYFCHNHTWMCLPDLENLTFSIPIFWPISHPSIYQFC